MLYYFVAFCVLSLGYSGLVVSTSVRGWKDCFPKWTVLRLWGH